MNPGIILAIVFGIIAFLAIVVLIPCIRIVKQTNRYVIERLGAYLTTWNVGIHFLCPFIDRVAYTVSMKELVKDFEPQPVITKDNVTMQIDTVVFFQVTDPKLYAYGVENPIQALENLSATTLRNIIGDLDLDDTLTSRDIINAKMRIILDEATDPWGMKVNRVELKNILPPKDIRDSMERQMKADRERREKILLAEGDKKSAILRAEGEKESAILSSEGAKTATILKAEGDKESTILRAQAEAEAILQVRKAEAEGIIMLKAAEGKGIGFIKDAKADDKVLTIKYYEALAKVADGKATKILLPADLGRLGSIATTISEVVKDNK